MQEEIANLKSENKNLQEKLKTKESLVYSKNCYWLPNEDRKDGPYCSHCWDKNRDLIRMHPQGNKAYYRCSECENSVQVYDDVESKIVNHNSIEDEDNSWSIGGF